MSLAEGDPNRPLYHYTPAENWANDPNGLVYYDGEYHLFYQYHPGGTSWGPMHWGHAVSRDLLRWQRLPVALAPDELGLIFSGCAVIDWHNTSGFGTEAMIAVFTHHAPWMERQSLAYSTDRGRTWTKYPGNPVLLAPPDTPDFRDPKVFWFEAGERSQWVMCLAAGHAVLFYQSPDLIHWTPTGSFGPGWGAQGKVWETPDLFQLPVTGTQDSRWVLVVSIGDGGPAGGSATQYFIGSFDGETFHSDYPPAEILWADHGADFYAPQSWSDAPNQRRLVIGWMSNWQYASLTPSGAWRGMFSVPRELALVHTPQGVRLVHQPVPELHALRGSKLAVQATVIAPDASVRPALGGETLELDAGLCPSPGVTSFGVRVRLGNGSMTTIGYDMGAQAVFIDRSQSGRSDFHPAFASRHAAPLALEAGCIHLHIFVDRTSVEVFAQHGRAVLTDSIYPSPHSQGLELFAEGGEVKISALDIWQLNPAGNPLNL